MKILLPPPDPKKWSMEIHCVGLYDNGCGATLLVQDGDIHYSRDSRSSVHEVITCPLCKKESGVSGTYPVYIKCRK